MPSTTNLNPSMRKDGILLLGFAFLVLWIAEALHAGRAPMTACCMGAALGCAVAFAAKPSSNAAPSERSRQSRLLLAACGLLMSLAAAACVLHGIPAIVCWAFGGFGCALCAFAWFTHMASLDAESAMRLPIAATAFALPVFAGLIAALPQPMPAVSAIVLLFGAVGSTGSLAFVDKTEPVGPDDNRDTTKPATNPSPGNAEQSDVTVDHPASISATGNASDLPAPKPSFLAAFLVPMMALMLYLGAFSSYAHDISANYQATAVLSMVLGALALATVLRWIALHLHNWDATPTFSALLTLALLAIIVLLFAEREQKVLLMALQLMARPFILVLLWISAITFVMRGTYPPNRAFSIPFFLASACLCIGSLLSTAPGLMHFLTVLPHEGIYLFTACLAVVLAYELSNAMGFFREANRPKTKSQPEEVTVKLEADYLTERCNALATEKALTDREREIVQLLALGRSRPFIAETLYLSENTVKWYCRQIYQKLDIHSKQELLTMLGVGE